MKTLTLPLISVVLGSLLAPAGAQVKMSLSSQKSYRQSKQGIYFKGGRFDVSATDGSAFYVGGCAVPYYLPLGTIGCPGGTTAFLIFGNITDVVSNGPYYWISSITPAVILEPRRPDLVKLTAAPASTLPRPSGGFKDNSYALYYNLHTTNVREYIISNYNLSRQYTKDQRSKFESEIVPGAYYYSFPRLGSPNLPAPISAQIYSMPEGLASLNHQTQGFVYENFGKWNQQGFMEISYIKPNIFKWKGLSPSTVYPAVDGLYLSLRVLTDPTDPASPTDLVDSDLGVPQSVFPAFATGGDPRVLLTNPFVTSFTAPPILAGGTRAILELEVDRGFQTGGVTYDYSTRRFQIPVEVVNKYSEYVDVVFEKSRVAGLLEDADGDGYNNLNEWILDSNANEAASIPFPPFAQGNVAVIDPDTLRPLRNQYYGFTINEKLDTQPDVVYTLQRSRDGGKSWTTFKSDADWSVREVHIKAGARPGRERDPAKTEIRVESKFVDLMTGEQLQPPGTVGDIYRVKITLK